MVMCIFYGGEEAVQQFLALYTHINHLRWHNIPREKALFHYMEELILYSFDACVVVLFLLYIYNKCNIKADGKAEQYMQNLSLQRFLEYIEDIYIVAFLRDICYNINQCILDLELPANGYQLAVILSSIDILSFTTNN